MKVSIALATYNGAAYLNEQLESFARQTRLPDELVVTDDASTDDTAAIVRAFADTAPFEVRLAVNPARLGYAQNFSRALSLTTGELVFLSDQDDVWLPGKVERVLALAASMPEAACFMTDAALADQDLRPSGATKWHQIRAAGLPDSAFVMGCCAAFRRPLLGLLLPVPAASPAHDNWLVQSAEALGLVHRSAEVLQMYRRHGANVSQFHVNQLQRPPWRQRLTTHWAGLLRRLRTINSLQAEWRFLSAMEERLQQQRAGCQTLLGAERAEQALARLGRKVQRLQQRRQWQALPRWQRLRPVALAWLGGHYEGGWRSALKDLWARSPGAAEGGL